MAVSRFGNLSTVFKGGRSPLLNRIARLAILYEDLRLEMREFQLAHRKVIELEEEDAENRFAYFLRRALETLTEFGRGLNVIRSMDEFKKAEPRLTAIDASYIANADRFLQQNWQRIKELRNEFGGHIQDGPIEFAMKHLSNEVGSVTWNPATDEWTIGIECDFAKTILVGVICSQLQSGTSVLEELHKANEMMADGFIHAQAAMAALVHAFLWDSFGK